MIGIVTSISIDKERARGESREATPEVIKDVMQAQYNGSGIYELTEDEDCVRLDLKPEVAAHDWTGLIEDFYKLRYGSVEAAPADMELIRSGRNLEEWIELSRKDSDEAYQYDTYGWISTPFHKGWARSLDTSMSMIVLSMDGKILMECFNDLFDFFTRIIREQLSKYRLAESLRVCISG